MPKTNRLPLVALILVLVALLAAPAGAETAASARQKRADAQRKRAAAAAQLNSLKASDEQLEAAVRALGQQVAAQQASAEAARQALNAAEESVRQSEAKIAATQQEMVELRTAVKERAILAYVQPQGAAADSYQATSINEASRRSAILAQVAARDQDILDRLRMVKQDLEEEKAKAAKQREIAAERRQAVDAKLSKLRSDKAALDEKARALDIRIKEYQSEVDAFAAQEAQFAAVIRQREAAARASRSASDPGTDGRVSGSGLIWPVRGPVTSEYGYRWGRMHSGIDIGGSTGTPIRAAKGGVVIFAGVQSGYGNVVVIDHGGGFTTLYAHQSRLATSDGQSVSQGQVIGYVGSTGRSTGPHLHFETRVNGGAQNPRRYLP